MAAGIATSMAANVYSQNVVGYANIILKGNGNYTLIANPLDDGNGNYLTNLMSSALTKQSQVLTWDPTATPPGYVTVTRGAAAWPAGTATQLPPGVGFFVRNGIPGSGVPDITNTFVGSVAVNVGGSVTNPIPLGFTLQGSVIPYAGNIANAGLTGGDTNLNYGGPLSKQSQILTWNNAATPPGFVTVTKGPTWPAVGGTVTIGVGQGFFINNNGTFGVNTNMVQNF